MEVSKKRRTRKIELFRLEDPLQRRKINNEQLTNQRARNGKQEHPIRRKTDFEYRLGLNVDTPTKWHGRNEKYCMYHFMHVSLSFAKTTSIV